MIISISPFVTASDWSLYFESIHRMLQFLTMTTGEAVNTC